MNFHRIQKITLLGLFFMFFFFFADFSEDDLLINTYIICRIHARLYMDFNWINVLSPIIFF